jgi:c(7)-type cytochrome triheme protein
MMRKLIVPALAAVIGLSAGWIATAQDKELKPPAKVVFGTKMGDVTFDHAKHLARVDGKCETCHTKLFPQSKAPINFKANMHKTAIAAKTACAACHVEGGPAFAVAATNCAKCHMKQ